MSTVTVSDRLRNAIGILVTYDDKRADRLALEIIQEIAGDAEHWSADQRGRAACLILEAAPIGQHPALEAALEDMANEAEAANAGDASADDDLVEMLAALPDGLGLELLRGVADLATSDPGTLALLHRVVLAATIPINAADRAVLLAEVATSAPFAAPFAGELLASGAA